MSDETVSPGGAEQIMDRIEGLTPDALAGAKAHIGVTFGCFVIRWGPYAPEEVGPMMTRLIEADPDRKIPFFVGLQCDAIDNPVETILGMGWVSKEEYARQQAELEQEERDHNGGFTVAEEKAQEGPDTNA
jgi:hypothetical protein